MRCRNCEEPIDVLDLCEICEMKPTLIEPVGVKLCDRGHFMTKGAGKTNSGWLCKVCRAMSQAKSKARRRESVA
jgi:hypothetical protein